MPECSCPPTGLLDTRCPSHGLFDGVRYPPMDRHAREVTVDRFPGPDGTVELTRRETAAEVQRRLYLAAAADRVRVAEAGFAYPVRRCPPRELGQR